MKKTKRISKKQYTRTTARSTEDIQLSTPESRTKPKTYEVMQIDSDDELGVVRLTAREIFEQNCTGQSPETFDGMDLEQVRARMRAQASRQVVIEDKWHPVDVGTIVEACTDYISEFRELKRLDSQQFTTNVGMPAEAIPHKKT